jgi:uncharacterized protein (TIGR03435 family)
MRRALIVMLGLAIGSTLSAQQPASDVAKATFDVASVKPNKSGDQGSRVGMSPSGRFMATNVTLKQLVSTAYNLRSFQVIGGPNWFDADRFDIVAVVGHEITPTAAGPPAELIAMVRNLLADRFRLLAHTETKEMPIFTMVLARPDGKFGPQLVASSFDCEAAMRAGTPPPSGPATAASQGRPIGPCSQRTGNGMLAARTATMGRLASTLSGLVDRLVTDKTGLAGSFDADVTWTPDPDVDTSGPSIFTALQEQLGLKLESAQGPMEVFVIDSAAAPTAD